jgi:4-aminobutyrate aminotransferase-like enzyme
VLRGLRTYYDAPFEPVRGEGKWLYDAGGERYLDAYNNVAHVGHCHPHVVDALCRQAALLNTNTRYVFPSVVEYAENLVAGVGPGFACIFTCTGSEANDLAWRLARNFTGKRGVITTQNAYHGNTTFLDSIDGSSTKGMRAPTDGWARVPAPCTTNIDGGDDVPRTAAAYGRYFGDAIAILESSGYAPAAWFVESYFCTDGVRLPPTGFLDDAVARLRRANALIIADEVQAGLGRSGSHLWAYQRLGVDADIVVMGKPMGNGHPIGVVVARREIIDAFYATDRYFNTFAGNPVSCAVGLAVLHVLEREHLQDNARHIGNLIRKGIASLSTRYPVLGDCRGQGLLIGVEIVQDGDRTAPDGRRARRIINEMCRRRVLIGLTGANRIERNVLKIRPPMVFDENGVGALLSTLEDTLVDLS